MSDKIKLAFAGVLVIAALAGFYIYSDTSLLMRVVVLLVAMGGALFIASMTAPGVAAIAYGRGAVIEIRKVVWPTRKETVQTTLMVLVMVVIVGLILWLFDMFLAWAVQLLTGQGG
ncbi:preprotein translocase subunit SecE [Ectothiorhodospiraceae bacterium BW-2]|nr:preprotein translocase subunit SecE [Ectothiorhodospiraceae bacterium BW-2]